MKNLGNVEEKLRMVDFIGSRREKGKNPKLHLPFSVEHTFTAKDLGLSQFERENNHRRIIVEKEGYRAWLAAENWLVWFKICGWSFASCRKSKVERIVSITRRT